MRSAGLPVACVLLLIGCVSVSTSPSPASPTPTPPTVTPAPPAAPTAEPTAPTPSPSPAPTSSAPAGEVIFSDDFSGATKYLSSGSQVDFGGSEYVDGVYRVAADPREGFVNYQGGGSTEGCSGTDCSFPDVLNNQLLTAHVEVDATQVSGSTSGSFGIACAYEGTGTLGFFVGLTISADGRRYAIAVNSAPVDTPIDQLKGGADRGDPHPAINQGIGALNHLRADCGEQSFSLWVNGALVATGELDEPLGEPDYQRGVGLVAAPSADEQVVVEFDNLVVSEQTDEPVVTPEADVAIFSDPLDTANSAWPTGDFQNASTIFTDAYTVTMTQPDAVAPIVPVTMLPPNDVSVQVDLNWLSGHELVSAGVMCRVSQFGWYSFHVRGDGRYSVSRRDRGVLEQLVDWTESNSNLPTGGTDTLRLDCVAGSLNAYLNGSPVATVFDSTFESGQFGLEVISPPEMTTEEPVVVQFRNFVASHVGL